MFINYLFYILAKVVYNKIIKRFQYTWVIIRHTFITFYLLGMHMKKKKIYLGFFYGSKQELTKAFTVITKGDFVRYIMTAETLICRFKSDKPIVEIIDILKEHCPDIPFFVFPISTKNWRYNLPLDVENNLLTDNPIIQTKQNQIINQYFIALLDEIKKKQLDPLLDENSPEHLDGMITHLGLKLKQAISEDNFELAAQIRDKVKELITKKNNLNNECTTTN